jgi:GTPase Era involved in 16S rRNA processing
MVYTQEFVDKCKNEYPDWDYLHELLNKNDESVGNYLANDFQSYYIYPYMIVQSNNFEELKEMAAKYLRREEIYLEWLIIYDEEHEDLYDEIADMISGKLCEELSEEVE